MIFLVQFEINKHLFIFSKTTIANCTFYAEIKNKYG